MRQIVLNLILNSLNYTQDGNIDIHIIDSSTNRKSIKITLTGAGMSKEKAASLFIHIDQGIKLTTH
ncbi:ATP-binding protein [Pseudoalteromonas sp. '520P1 No. 423']|uniref:ATP-binding protein n=1 Tax=unclassified Pseudoalteromonas TaxID=194690 RepID=UPI003526EB4F